MVTKRSKVPVFIRTLICSFLTLWVLQTIPFFWFFFSLPDWGCSYWNCQQYNVGGWPRVVDGSKGRQSLHQDCTMCGTDCRSNTDQQDSSYIKGISKNYKMFCKVFFLLNSICKTKIFFKYHQWYKKWFSLISFIYCYNIVFTTISF